VKLKSYIFRWVTLATLLPATALGLFASYYVQNLYHEDATEDILRSLENISTEITRSLQTEQQLIFKLSESDAIRQFLPVLEQARLHQRHSEYDQRFRYLSDFLQQYQTVISSFDTFRIIDIRGNTLLKVRSGEESKTRYEGFDPYAIMDKEVIAPEHIKRLTDLSSTNVSFIELPQTREEMGQENNIVIPDSVIPLNYQGKRVGYLAVTINGTSIDQLLELAARVFDGRLLIAEIDEENKVRNGQILYDDSKMLRFEHLKSTVENLQNLNKGVIWDAIQEQPYGAVAHEASHSRYYYIEYFPYPDSLTSWIIASKVEDSSITQPFQSIRTGIAVLAGIAVLSSLFLAHFASRAISTPIMYLAENLKTYADGKKPVPIKSEIDEMQESSESFTYMAEKLEHAQQERQKAENMMIQNAKLASLGQMAAGIGHEINNPLNNIRTLSRLMRRELEKNEQVLTSNKCQAMLDDIESLDEEVIRASDIVQGVLSFARQIPEKEFTRINMAKLLIKLEGLVRQEARRTQVNLTGIDEIASQKDLIVMGDQGKLQQALVNIILNAIQASSETDKEKRRIELSVETEQAMMTLTIRDHGTGIDEAILDQIFDPFFTTKKVGQGTGLGLSISLGIIQKHNGHLDIKNAENGGAVVRITLPLSKVS
jgi:two-component system NtrC family sensor kinase